MTKLYKKYIGGYDFFEYDSLKSYLCFKIPFIILLAVLFYLNLTVTLITAFLFCVCLLIKTVLTSKSGFVVADCALLYLVLAMFFINGKAQYFGYIFVPVLVFDVFLKVVFAFFDRRYDLDFEISPKRYRFISQAKEDSFSKKDIIMLSENEICPCDAYVVEGTATVDNLIFENSEQRVAKKGDRVFFADSVSAGNVKLCVELPACETCGAKALEGIKDAIEEDMKLLLPFAYFQIVCLAAISVLYFAFKEACFANICAITFCSSSAFICGIYFLFSAIKSLLFARRGLYTCTAHESLVSCSNDEKTLCKRHVKLTLRIMTAIFIIAFGISAVFGILLPVFCSITAELILIYISLIKLPDIKNERTTPDEET